MREPRTVGFIDIGTNSVHLLVVRFIHGTNGVDIAQEREVIRLGRSLYGSGSIDEAAISKCRLVIDRFTDYARRQGAEEVYAYATCASREAENGQRLVEALSNPGLELRIISGEEEARLIRLGVLGRTHETDNKLLIDIGGGSTELSLFGKDGTSYYVSLPLGAVRFAYHYPYDPMSPLSEEGYSEYVSEIRRIASSAVSRIREIGFDEVIGSSGTFETLADICSDDKNEVTRQQIYSWMTGVRKMDIERRRKIPKLNPDRADIIIAGGTVAETLLSMLGDPKVTISRSGLKEGMMVDFSKKNGFDEVPLRESSVNTLLFRSSADVYHALKVRDYSLKIFDRLKGLGLHDMGEGTRELLGYASKLHDIGEFFSYRKHHVISSNMILDVGMSGFDQEELATMSTIVRYHHKRMPSQTDIRRICSADFDSLLKCISILRLADALDRHRSQIVRDIELKLDGEIVSLAIISDDDVSMEIWRANDCRKDFASIFGKELVILRYPYI